MSSYDIDMKRLSILIDWLIDFNMSTRLALFYVKR